MAMAFDTPAALSWLVAVWTVRGYGMFVARDCSWFFLTVARRFRRPEATMQGIVIVGSSYPWHRP